MAAFSTLYNRWLSTLLLIVLCCCCDPSAAAYPSPHNITLLPRTSNAAPPLPLTPSTSHSATTSSNPGDVTTSVTPAKSSPSPNINFVAPSISRVSGCVDEAELTRECPIHTHFDLTMYGRNFQRTALDIVLTGNDSTVQCHTVRVSTSEVLRCSLDTSNLPLRRRELLNVSVNSSLGGSTLHDAIGVDAEVTQPRITAVSGCFDDGAHTRNCTQSSEVRLTGTHFPRWLDPSIVIAGQVELACEWNSEVLGVSCSLDDERVRELPTGQLLPVQVRFSYDRVSAPVTGLAMHNSRPQPPQPPPTQPPAQPSSSTSPPQPPSSDDNPPTHDDLQPVKVTLFITSVMALAAILGGAVVWAVGLWSAHRRAFVSAHSQAAVDMRHVLLHC